ncbi:MAG: hypothetical protein EBS05_13795 [Proteobacteria bacterium]|nr:hypothetical protein [Pseudomonadota bacterium]
MNDETTSVSRPKGRHFPSFPPDVADAVEKNLIVQGFIVFFASMVLDGGALFQVVALPATAYWLTVLAVLLRRPQSLTRLDAFLLKAGFIVYGIALSFTTPWWGWLRKLLP